MKDESLASFTSCLFCCFSFFKKRRRKRTRWQAQHFYPLPTKRLTIQISLSYSARERNLGRVEVRGSVKSADYFAGSMIWESRVKGNKLQLFNECMAKDVLLWCLIVLMAKTFGLCPRNKTGWIRSKKVYNQTRPYLEGTSLLLSTTHQVTVHWKNNFGAFSRGIIFI